MLVDGVPYRSIWLSDDEAVHIIDQTLLPHEFETRRLRNVEDAAEAIRHMRVRGAPLIGATAAWGIWLAMRQDAGDVSLQLALDALAATRPTAVNLHAALDEMRAGVAGLPEKRRTAAAQALAQALCDRDVAVNRAIGEHGLALLRDMAGERGGILNVLTHCNAGWLATVDWGTVTAPIYAAHAEGLRLHVWVDETRPRIQGALTAWELRHAGVPHTLVTDNAGGHLMQRGDVDLCLVGSDRTTAGGDVANKIGTYLKALAARDNDIPFYVALPSSTIDWTLDEGVGTIPIEERPGDELRTIRGRDARGGEAAVRIVPPDTPVSNPAFDVTPRRLVSGLITERGVAQPDRDSLLNLFPEQATEHAGTRRPA